MMFSIMDFRSCIKVRVVLGKSLTQIYADLHAESPSFVPSANTVFKQLNKLKILVGILVYKTSSVK